MTQINTTYLLKLIEASEALSAEKKATLKTKVAGFNEAQYTQLKNILEGEQKFNAEHYRKVGQIKTLAAEKKIRLVYNYAEKKLNLEEEQDLAVLEDQLTNLEA